MTRALDGIAAPQRCKWRGGPPFGSRPRLREFGGAVSAAAKLTGGLTERQWDLADRGVRPRRGGRPREDVGVFERRARVEERLVHAFAVAG